MFNEAKKIIGDVARESGLSRDDLIGWGRSKTVMHARRKALKLVCHKTTMSLSEVGALFGGRSKSTVCNIVNRKK